MSAVELVSAAKLRMFLLYNCRWGEFSSSVWNQMEPEQNTFWDGFTSASLNPRSGTWTVKEIQVTIGVHHYMGFELQTLLYQATKRIYFRYTIGSVVNLWVNELRMSCRLTSRLCNALRWPDCEKFDLIGKAEGCSHPHVGVTKVLKPVWKESSCFLWDLNPGLGFRGSMPTQWPKEKRLKAPTVRYQFLKE